MFSSHSIQYSVNSLYIYIKGNTNYRYVTLINNSFCSKYNPIKIAKISDYEGVGFHIF